MTSMSTPGAMEPSAPAMAAPAPDHNAMDRPAGAVAPENQALAHGGGSGPGDPGQRRRCATMDTHHRLLDEVPWYAASRASVETALLMAQASEVSRAGVYRIPVVVHVVHANDTQNVSKEQVDSQISVLNADFRGSNPDTSIVPAPFAPLIADARVEFFLADKDPDGNPTDGVTRRRTTVTSFSHTDDAVKFTARGGTDAWPADRYLNLWAAPLRGGLLGYAQFPGGPAATDGVVVTTTGFGTTGTATAPFDLGRTATHEIGHYLDLFHIWGDDGTGCGGTDEVDDTPNQAGPNGGVPTFPRVTCNNGPHGDLFYDYMDYTDDRGMVMFTHGQVARMHACLETVRSSLWVADTGATPEPPGPVVPWDANRLDAFVLGTDHAMYHKWWDGSAWGPSVDGYESLGGIALTEPVVAAWAPDRLDAFVLGTDRQLYHKWWDGSAWGPSFTGWEALGGVCMSKPAVASWGENRLDVFVKGTDSAIYHKWWDGSAWGPSVDGWEYQGGVCTSAPEVVAWGENRLDLFVLGTDQALYHKWWDGAAWGPSVDGWEHLGGVCASPPTAVAWGENRLDVFVLGTDHALYHKWWDGSAWGPSIDGWEHLGGVCASAPTAVAWGENRLDLFVIGTDSALHHKWWDGSAWGPSVDGWESLGGVCMGQPRAASWGENRLDVFVVGTDSALYHKWWDGSAWGPSLTGYEYQGGIITKF